MIKIREIENCQSVCSIGKEVSYIKGADLYVAENIKVSSGNKIHNVSSDKWKLVCGGSRIIVVDDLNRVCGELRDGELSEVSYPLTELRISKAIGDLLFVYVKKPERKRGVYDLLDDKLLFLESNFSPSFVSGNYAFGVGSVISQFDIKNLNSVDVFEASEVSLKDTFERILNVHDNRVIVIMSDGCICEFDLRDKSFSKWESFDDEVLSHKTLSTEVPQEIYKSRLGTFSKRSAVYIGDQNKVVGFEYGVYWEIDLDAKSLNVTSMFDEFNSNNISGCWSNVIVDGSIIYFVSDQAYQENQNHKLVGFDISSRKVVTQWSLPMASQRRGFAITGPIKLGDDIIGAIEQDSTCHLFNIKLNHSATS